MRRRYNPIWNNSDNDDLENEFEDEFEDEDEDEDESEDESSNGALTRPYSRPYEFNRNPDCQNCNGDSCSCETEDNSESTTSNEVPNSLYRYRRRNPEFTGGTELARKIFSPNKLGAWGSYKRNLRRRNPLGGSLFETLYTRRNPCSDVCTCDSAPRSPRRWRNPFTCGDTPSRNRWFRNPCTCDTCTCDTDEPVKNPRGLRRRAKFMARPWGSPSYSSGFGRWNSRRRPLGFRRNVWDAEY